jgi:deazaflavin-dependent oxidoreductase (nitroreductase family)
MVIWLTKLGINAVGARILLVPGRRSGQVRSTPVQVLAVNGGEYLVAPRGHTQWTRNLRAAGGGELQMGRKTERFTATEVDDAAKPELLRAYVAKYKQANLFRISGPQESDERLREIAPDHPVFRITRTG